MCHLHKIELRWRNDDVFGFNGLSSKIGSPTQVKKSRMCFNELTEKSIKYIWYFSTVFSTGQKVYKGDSHGTTTILDTAAYILITTAILSTCLSTLSTQSPASQADIILSQLTTSLSPAQAAPARPAQAPPCSSQRAPPLSV
eukprot:COSAG06_NODE_262_length_18897_cov_122.542877_6_plen_142_part_00